MKWEWKIPPTLVVAFGICVTALFLSALSPKSSLEPADWEGRFTLQEAFRALGPGRKQPISPIWHAEGENYIFLELDCAGLNNVWMAFEIAVGLSWLFDRTLIIPPSSKIDHLKDPIHVFDIFDEESLRSQIKIVHFQDHFSNMTPEGARRVLQSTNAEGSLNPERATYEDAATRVHEQYWVTGGCERNRLFGHVTCFFKERSPHVHHMLRRALRFNSSVIEKTNELAETMGLSDAGGLYDAVHMRKGDFSQVTKHIPPAGEFAREVNALTESDRVVLLTDGTENDIRDFREVVRGTVLVFPKLNYNLQCVCEMLIAACGGRFVGTALSTFSTRIVNLRGQLSNKFDCVHESVFVGSELIPSTQSETCWWLVDSESWAPRR